MCSTVTVPPRSTMATQDADNMQPLVQRYRQLIAGASASRPAFPVRHSPRKPMTIYRRSIAAALGDSEESIVPPSSSLPSRLHSTIDGKDQLLELHNHAPDGLGTLPEEDAASRRARYKSFFDRLDLGRHVVVAGVVCRNGCWAADNTGQISQDNLHAEMERIQLPSSDQQHATRIMDEMGSEQGQSATMAVAARLMRWSCRRSMGRVPSVVCREGAVTSPGIKHMHACTHALARRSTHDAVHRCLTPLTTSKTGSCRRRKSGLLSCNLILR